MATRQDKVAAGLDKEGDDVDKVRALQPEVLLLEKVEDLQLNREMKIWHGS